MQHIRAWPAWIQSRKTKERVLGVLVAVPCSAISTAEMPVVDFSVVLSGLIRNQLGATGVMPRCCGLVLRSAAPAPESRRRTFPIRKKCGAQHFLRQRPPAPASSSAARDRHRRSANHLMVVERRVCESSFNPTRGVLPRRPREHSRCQRARARTVPPLALAILAVDQGSELPLVARSMTPSRAPETFPGVPYIYHCAWHRRLLMQQQEPPIRSLSMRIAQSLQR